MRGVLTSEYKKLFMDYLYLKNIQYSIKKITLKVYIWFFINNRKKILEDILAQLHVISLDYIKLAGKFLISDEDSINCINYLRYDLIYHLLKFKWDSDYLQILKLD